MTGRERAVSVPINYTMSIVVVTVLMTGLMISTADQLEAQQERTVESEFGVLGNRLAADVSAADRLAVTTEGTPDDVVAVRTDIPKTVADVNYRIEITSTEIVAGESYQVVFTFVALGLDVTEEVRLKTATRVVNTTVTGGQYVVEYVDTDGDDAPDALEVHNV